MYPGCSSPTDTLIPKPYRHGFYPTFDGKNNGRPERMAYGLQIPTEMTRFSYTGSQQSLL